MKLLSILALTASSSLGGFASSFGLLAAAQFHHHHVSRKSMLASTTTTSQSSDATCNEEDTTLDNIQSDDTTKSKSEKRLVKFIATRTHLTPPLPLPTAPATLDDFFSKKRNCDLLFSAKATLTDVDDPSPQLFEMLKDSSTYYQAVASDTDQSLPEYTATTPIRFIELANAPMHFIGVTLHSTATVGIQYLQASDFKGSKQQAHFGPEFHFYLLSTNLQAKGPPPLVWLFYKLIGKKQGEHGISTAAASRFQTSGFTRVWAELKGRNRVVFHNAARLESKLRIPSVLLSLIPFSVQHLEEKGSATLQDAIDKDMEPAAERFQEAYEKWLDEE